MKDLYIKCSNCGAEYLPAEIFVPNEFFGKPQNIIRDENNQIISYNGNNMDLTDQYRCDYCGTTFKVSAKINFLTNSIINYEKEYSSSLKKNTLFLQED